MGTTEKNQAAELVKTACVFFDIDGTWFRWQLFEIWISYCVKYGVLPRIVLEQAADSLRAYKNRTGDFSTWVNTQVAAYQDEERLKGVRVADAELAAQRAIQDRGQEIHRFPQALSEAAKTCAMRRAIISGSMTEVVRPFAHANGIHLFLGTEHPKEGGVFTGGLPHVWAENKGSAVHHFAKEHGLDLSTSVAVGDSKGDISMFTLVRYPICFNPDAKLLEIARVRRWPVVWEKKNVISIFRPSRLRRLHEVELSEVLPSALAHEVASTLGLKRW